MSSQSSPAIDNQLPRSLLSEAEVGLAKTRLLFRNAGMAQVVTVINGALLLFVLGGLSPPLWAVGWWLVMVVVAVYRYLLARRFLNSDPSAAQAAYWRSLALRGALAAGLVLAGGGVAMMLADPESTRLFAALVMAGMVAGAVPILSSVPGAFSVYAAPVMLSIILTALFDFHGPRDAMLALVATLYLAALARSASYFHDSLDNSIRLAIRMRQMADQLDIARRGAEAASSAKSQFLAAMSHEIRTPMNGILGMAQLLLMPGMDEAERQDSARTILNSGQTLLALLNDILDLSKVEAGKFELQRVAFNPQQLVTEIAALFGEMAHAKGLAIDSTWAGPEAQRYWTDPGRVRQMLANLVNNAIKFTQQGAIRIDARVIESDPATALIEFSVSDTGIGIAADKQALLFEPFSQVDGTNTRQFGGTGLGLSIVRSLATLLGGSVGFTSQAGQGARFWFRIRADIVAPGEDSRESDRSSAVGERTGSPRPSSSGRRVLVVEDNPVNVKVVSALLRKQGLVVDHVGNGELAVRALVSGSRPDLVLMDCQMPVMDGFEATRRIRQWERDSGQAPVPIVALTASAFEDDRDHCSAAGMDDFLAKPLEMKRLQAILAKWLVASEPVQKE